jgi:hypothetical protein
MAKLNQIIAISNGKKTQAHKTTTEIYQRLQKAELLVGLARTYRPKDEDGDKLPAEKKLVQQRVRDAIRTARSSYTELINIVATQDYANTRATADVIVDNKVLLPNVPVTHLLFLEKQLVDLHTFVDKLPTLDPGETWTYNEAQDCYASDPAETRSTKKVMRNHVKAAATDKHPAQVDVYTEDVIVGFWSSVRFSGAIPAKEKNEMLERVRKLQEAVKASREHANSIEVDNQEVAEPLLNFIFGKN